MSVSVHDRTILMVTAWIHSLVSGADLEASLLLLFLAGEIYSHLSLA
jgi:hypothetical protein